MNHCDTVIGVKLNRNRPRVRLVVGLRRVDDALDLVVGWEQHLLVHGLEVRNKNSDFQNEEEKERKENQ
jgi:hypothetical protein